MMFDCSRQFVQLVWILDALLFTARPCFGLSRHNKEVTWMITWHVIITRSTQMRSLVVPFRLQTKSHSFVHAETKTANQTAMCCIAEKHSYLERWSCLIERENVGIVISRIRPRWSLPSSQNESMHSVQSLSLACGVDAARGTLEFKLSHVTSKKRSFLLTLGLHH